MNRVYLPSARGGSITPYRFKSFLPPIKEEANTSLTNSPTSSFTAESLKTTNLGNLLEKVRGLKSIGLAKKTKTANINFSL